MTILAGLGLLLAAAVPIGLVLRRAGTGRESAINLAVDAEQRLREAEQDPCNDAKWALAGLAFAWAAQNSEGAQAVILFKKAVSAYRKACKTHPEHPDHPFELACVLLFFAVAEPEHAAEHLAAAEAARKRPTAGSPETSARFRYAQGLLELAARGPLDDVREELFEGACVTYAKLKADGEVNDHLEYVWGGRLRTLCDQATQALRAKIAGALIEESFDFLHRRLDSGKPDLTPANGMWVSYPDGSRAKLPASDLEPRLEWILAAAPLLGEAGFGPLGQLCAVADKLLYATKGAQVELMESLLARIFLSRIELTPDPEVKKRLLSAAELLPERSLDPPTRAEISRRRAALDKAGTATPARQIGDADSTTSRAAGSNRPTVDAAPRIDEQRIAPGSLEQARKRLLTHLSLRLKLACSEIAHSRKSTGAEDPNRS